MLGDVGQNIDTSTPNTRYKSQNLGTWSSVEDVDSFLYRCRHVTGYYGATIGSYVTIMDGIYNKEWVIAGFDMEHNKTTLDGITYDNGYGICLIPKKSLGNYAWSHKVSGYTNNYKSSDINKTILPDVANNLKKVLGDHLVLRNVLLSSARNSSYYASAYTWTTAYCTLMSAGQITGTFASNSNKYDDGEANYKLPLFNYEAWSFDELAWLRGLHNSRSNLGVYCITTSGDVAKRDCDNSGGLRPLIYIR